MKTTSFTVCVNYDDLLAITLPRICGAVDKAVVVTSERDWATVEVAKGHGATVYQTDRFYSGGAAFNKAAALEEATAAEEHGPWMLLIDADTVLPPSFQVEALLNAGALRRDTLYGARRRIAKDIRALQQVLQGPGGWAQKLCPPTRDKDEIPGYFQLFWSPGVERPWFQLSWEHAGGYDTCFQERFARREVLPYSIIHLGEPGRNWQGRRTDRWAGSGSGMHYAPGAIERAYTQHREDVRTMGPLAARKCRIESEE